ncbi:OmpA family protein [Gemmatimonas aurantiaca]|nr:OmpA family protein [Gemmatimonas aurantiaca]
MKNYKVIPIVMITFLALAAMKCGPTETPPEEINPADTATPPPPPPPPPPPEPEVRQISESEFQTVYFDFDKSAVKSEFAGALESNAALLKESMDMIVKVEGHCDERGTVEYNIALSEQRAQAVKSYLINLGIAESRIQTNGLGKELPAMMGHNEAAWSKNRRVEFRIVSQ